MEWRECLRLTVHGHLLGKVCIAKGGIQAVVLFGKWEAPEDKRQSISVIPLSMMQLYVQELSVLLLGYLLVALRLWLWGSPFPFRPFTAETFVGKEYMGSVTQVKAWSHSSPWGSLVLPVVFLQQTSVSAVLTSGWHPGAGIRPSKTRNPVKVIKKGKRYL